VSTVERLDAMVEPAARALFEHHGLSLPRASGEVDETPMDHDVAAAVGFTSPNVHGAVVMTTRKDIVARAWPRELRHREPSERDVCDWTGELVNQLLGRVKNGLASFGVTLDQGTPTVVTGRHLHRVPASTNIARRYSFAVPGGSLLVYFDATLAEGFELAPSDGAMQAAAEGDLRLF
jgi:CheY-specific phosphatase CheX